MKLPRLTALLLAVTVTLGCGSKGPELIPVKGTITLDGEPLRLKNLFFSPEEGTPGMGAGGNTKEDGSFELLAVVGGAVKDMKGAPAGTYRVVVAEPMFPIESPDWVVQGRTSEPEVAVGLPEMTPKKEGQVIPRIYTDASTTPLRARVQLGDGDVKLEMTSTGQ